MQPHDHQHVLGVLKDATQADAQGGGQRGHRGRARVARDALRRAVPRSSSRPPTCSPVRGGSGSTPRPMLGQSKTAYQAEIDAPAS